MIEVLIVGAGPTGLTLALDLARRGVSYRIVDKEPAFAVGSRGRGMQPRTQEVFDDLGLIDAVLANGSTYPPMRAYQGGEIVWEGAIGESLPPTAAVPYPNPWMIPQWRLTELLRERLPVAVELDTELTGVEQDTDGVIATLRHAGSVQRVRVAYLVGADGGRGVTRKLLGVGFEGVTSDDFRMLVGDVKADGVDREHWHIWRPESTTGAMAGLCPMGGTDSFQLTLSLPDRALSTLDEVQAYFTEVTKTDIRLHTLTWLTEWRPNTRLATRYRVGRVFLAGDAAHVHPPTGGQGMNTGVQDAYNLGWKLGAVLRGAPEALLDSYEQERLPVAAHVLGLSDRLLGQAVNGTGDPAALRRGLEERQLGITYREGPLAVDDRAERGAVVAGDRAPDGPAGHRRLFDVFRGPHFTLLELTTPELCRSYDVPPGTLVLVRPDGYIGVITRDRAVVDAYLGSVQAVNAPEKVVSPA
ncbi:MAG: FAD-dependent monooxygenase [Kibdelosporangium sp.]